MIHSMTGYGRGECASCDRRFKVEIRCVNHRYSDINIKMPRFLNPFEDAVRKRLTRDIRRGKADVYIQFESAARQDVQIGLNVAFADAYTAALRTLAERAQLTDGVTLPLLAAHPDMFNVEKDVFDDETSTVLWETLSDALEDALVRFNAMREAEGNALRLDLLDKRTHMWGLLTQIREHAPTVAAEYAKRLRERVAEALAGTGFVPDEGRLLTEIALFADRACVDEEITRLDSHIAQLGEMLATNGGAVGRKLDFLTQEMNREANTIGSKSNDATLTGLVVQLKAEVEKIREQVQNIE